MFQFPPCPPTGLCVQPVVTEYCSAGFPHSGTSGSTVDDTSPELIAAIRALLRLLAPRHPPHALSSLIHVRRQHLIIETSVPAGQVTDATCCVLLLFHSVVKVPRLLLAQSRSPNDLAQPRTPCEMREPLVAALDADPSGPTHQVLNRRYSPCQSHPSRTQNRLAHRQAHLSAPYDCPVRPLCDSQRPGALCQIVPLLPVLATC